MEKLQAFHTQQTMAANFNLEEDNAHKKNQNNERGLNILKISENDIFNNQQSNLKLKIKNQLLKEIIPDKGYMRKSQNNNTDIYSSH